MDKIKIVQDALDSIRPFLKMDGGDIELIEIDEQNVVKIKLLGNCSSCDMSHMTMKAGIEEAIRKVFPEVSSVLSVA
ncbi:MAG: NifU family protein [Bacteroidota bacterium]|jgi:Fe-S cluster biogenesis protein NfuA|nr:NifU family protein [Bacteroidota bacterium]